MEAEPIVPKDIVLPSDWHARDYQKDFWNFMESGGKRAICVWHRRAGKDQSTLNLTAVETAKRRGSYWHVLPTKAQGREIVWEGMDNSGKPFLDAFPYDYITRRRDDHMKLWLASGSTWHVVGADDPDKRQVGTNPVGIVFSEYSVTGKMRTLWDYARPILAANGGWAVFIFTPRGKNHAFTMYKMAQQEEDWFCQLLTVDDTWYTNAEGVRVPVVTAEAIDADRRSGMSEAMIQQEYFCSFSGPLEEAFYGDLMVRAEEEGRIGQYPWISNEACDTGWDLGYSDHTAFWVTQKPARGGQRRLIKFYWGSRNNFDHYIGKLREFPYSYRYHIGPHDIRHQRQHMNDSASIYQQSKHYGVHFRVAPKLPVRDGIMATRALLSNVLIDEEGVGDDGLRCLREYKRSRDQKSDEYTDMPVRNWATHGADALRTLAIGLPREAEGLWSREGGSLYTKETIV